MFANIQKRWALLVIVTLASVARAKDPTSALAGESDAALRSYHAGNGLLNRGMYEAAIAEYRTFLASAPDQEKAAIARYGIVVSLYRLDRCDEALTELEPVRKSKKPPFEAESMAIEAQCLMVKERFADAAAVYEDIARRFEKSELADDAGAGLCEAMFRAGEYDRATEACAAAQAKWPGSPMNARTMFFGALADLSRRNFDAACKALSSYEKKFPTSEFAAQVPMLLAQCYQGGGDAARSAESYAAVVRNGNESQQPDALLGLATVLQQDARHDDARKALDELFEKYPDSPAAQRALELRAHVWFALEEWAKALPAFGLAGKKDAAWMAESQYWMAKCEMRLGENQAAAQRLESAIKAHPENRLVPEMQYDRAVALIRAEQWQSAEQALDLFLKRNPDHALAAEALHMAATTAHQRGDYDQSAVRCQQFLKSQPQSDRVAAVTLLSAENEFLSGRFEPAARQYAEFEKRFPRDDKLNEVRLRLATALYQSGSLDESARYFEMVCPLAKKNELYLPALLALGDMAFQRGEWKNAEQRFSEFLAIRPAGASSDDAMLKLAFSRQKQGRSAEAIRDYDLLIERFPGSNHVTQAWFEKGQLLAAAGQEDEAAEAFERVLSGDAQKRFTVPALNQKAQLALQRGAHEEAAGYYAQAAGSADGADQSGPALMRQGQSLMAAEKFAEAEVVFRKIKSPEGQARLAISLARQDKHEDALKIIASIESGDGFARLAPELQAALLYEKAWALRESDQKDQAIAAYRKLAAVESNIELTLNARLELAELEFESGDIESAAGGLRELRQSLAGEPARSELAATALQRLAVCEFELEHFKEAGEHFEALFNEDPKRQDDPQTMLLAGEAAFRAGRLDRATALLGRAAEAKNASAQCAESALLRLGESYAALQKWARSEEVFQQLIERYPQSEQWFQAQFGVGWAREQQKRYDEAVSSYEKVVARHQGPTAARAQFQIGQCLFAQKKFEAAIRELLKVDILYAYPEWSAAALYEAGRCFSQMNDPAQARQQFNAVVEKFKETKWAELAGRQLAELASSAALPGK